MPRAKKQQLKRRPDGRYCCRYKDKWFMADSSDEALAARDRYKQEEREGLVIKRQQPTLHDYAARWLPIHKKGVRDTTYNGYASVLDHTIAPIGGKLLSDLTADDIALAYSSMTDKSASYIHKAKILLNAILDSAVDAGYILKNPARAKSVKPPKGTSGTHRALTKAEISLVQSTPHRMQLPAMVMLYAGLRRGEALALSASDIKNNTITVSRAVSYTSNQPIVSGTKTAAGVRSVPVVSVLQPYLKGLSGLIAPGKDGKPMTEQAFQRGWENYMKTLSAAAKREISFRPHDLRHTYCTMLRDAGVDIHQAIIWMGHADEKMILRIYDHPGQARETSAKNALEAEIRRQNGRQNKSYHLKNGSIPSLSAK